MFCSEEDSLLEVFRIEIIIPLLQDETVSEMGRRERLSGLLEDLVNHERLVYRTLAFYKD